MNPQYVEQVKSAAAAIDQETIAAVYPEAFCERWAQFAPYGAEMPKSAAELDALIESAYELSKVKQAQAIRNGGVRPSSQIARVFDMAKRAAHEHGVGGDQGAGALERFDLSGAVNALRAITG